MDRNKKEDEGLALTVLQRNLEPLHHESPLTPKFPAGIWVDMAEQYSWDAPGKSRLS